MIELLSGFLIGIMSSFLVWYLLYRRLVPSLEFSPKVYREKSDENPSGYVYRIRFRNIGKRTLIDIELFAKLRIQGISPLKSTYWRAIYLPIDDPRIPKIESQRKSKKRTSVRLLITQLSESSISILPLKIQKKCQDDKICLEDLFSAGRSTLQIFAFGYDEFSGARKIFESKLYTLEDIEDENIT
jgi:hypothetical protein